MDSLFPGFYPNPARAYGDCIPRERDRGDLYGFYRFRELSHAEMQRPSHHHHILRQSNSRLLWWKCESFELY